jgi:hypothetical protein
LIHRAIVHNISAVPGRSVSIQRKDLHRQQQNKCNFLGFPDLILLQLRMKGHKIPEFYLHVYWISAGHGLDEIKPQGKDSSRISINELATFKAEVQFEEKDRVRNSNYFSHRCMFDSIFCGKTEGIESDTPE